MLLWISINNFRTFVSFGEKNRSIGTSGKNQLISNISNTVWGFKRLLGLKYQDPYVQSNLEWFNYKISQLPDGGIGIKVCIA